MNQEQIQPDYNYILQQQAPDARPPKKKKLTYVLFGALVILIIVTVVALIASALFVRKNPQPEMIRSHTDAAQRFITSMNNKEYQTIADSQLASNIKLSNTAANIALLERFGSTTDFATCVSLSHTAQDDGSFENTYRCDGSSGAKQKTIIITTDEENGTIKIKGHKLDASQTQS